MATLTVNGASNRGQGSRRGGVAVEGGTLNCGNWRRDECNSKELRAREKNIRKIKSQTKIKVLKVNNANWHFASRQAAEKRLKKTARKKSKKKNVLLQDDDDGGKPSRSPIENDSCSYFSVFSFRISIFGFGFGWKSESTKVTKWLNFGVRHSALNVRLPACLLHVACCKLAIDCWLLGRLWPIGRKSEKSRNTWGQGVASTAVASCCHTMWQCLCVCVGALWIDDRVEICSHVTFKFVGKSSAREIEEKPEETPAACHSCCHTAVAAAAAFRLFMPFWANKSCTIFL